MKPGLWFIVGISTVLSACGVDDTAETAETGDTEEEEEVHFAYEGEHGPEHWGDLDPEWATCGTGTEQSPIDLVSTLTVTDIDDVVLTYGSSDVDIVNNGHTIQYNYDAGSYVTIGGARYDLKQFHFHAPSEHSIDGEEFPMELHLVHQDTSGALAVLGLLIEVGAENTVLAGADWSSIPATAEGTHTSSTTFAIGGIVPAGNWYSYAGSLTTPPCTEGVAWHVAATPITMSAAQIAVYTDIYDNTDRPIQTLGSRTVELGQ